GHHSPDLPPPHLDRHRQHRLHHGHQQQSNRAPATGALHNCQIIESSNAVVIKCFDGTDLYQSVAEQSRLSPPINGSEPEQGRFRFFEGENQSTNRTCLFPLAAAVSPRLTYHVQVFRVDNLTSTSKSATGELSTTASSSDSQYSHQISQQNSRNPEPGK